jgi:hypothetical protein
MEMATLDDLNDRVRFLESEVAGEKVVTRHILEQVSHNSTDLAVFRSETTRALDQLRGDMALVKAAQISQGGALNILVQDVRELRTVLNAQAQDVREMRTVLNAQAQDVREMRKALDAQAQDVLQVRTDVGEIRARLDMLERDIGAILAAVAPKNPPPGAA